MASSADLVIRILADTSSADRALSGLTGNLGKALGIGAVGAGAAAVTQAAVDWQDAMAHIASAYNDVNFQPGNARFDEVQKFLRDLSTTSATSAGDLADVFNVAARFAPDSTKAAEDFTDAVVRLTKVSSDLTDSTGTAQHLAQFLRIFNDTNSQGVASAIAKLGSMHTQGEGPVLEMAQQMAQAGSQIGLTEAQILGLSNVLVDVGERSNTGGSAISRMFIELGQAAAVAGSSVDENTKKIHDGTQRIGDLQDQLAIAQQRKSQMFGQHGLKTQYRRDPAAVMEADYQIKRLQEEIANQQSDLSAATDPQAASRQLGQRINIGEAANLAGMSTSDFAQSFQDDPFSAFTSIIGGLKGLDEKDQAGALGKLGIKNIRDIKTIEALVSRFDQIGPNVGAAQSEIDNPQALGTRTEPILSDTKSKQQDVADAANVAAQVIGEPLREKLDQGLSTVLAEVQNNGFDPLVAALGKMDTVVDAANSALGTFIQQIGVAGGLQLAAAGIGAGRALAGVAGSAGSGGSAVTGASAPSVTGPVGPTNFIAGGAAAGAGILATMLGEELEKQVESILHDKGLTGVDAKGTTQAAQVQIGDITVHAANPLGDVIAAVTQKITEAWNAAQSGHVVSGQVGGNYTTGQAPH